MTLGIPTINLIYLCIFFIHERIYAYCLTIASSDNRLKSITRLRTIITENDFIYFYFFTFLHSLCLSRQKNDPKLLGRPQYFGSQYMKLCGFLPDSKLLILRLNDTIASVTITYVYYLI